MRSAASASAMSEETATPTPIPALALVLSPFEGFEELIFTPLVSEGRVGEDPGEAAGVKETPIRLAREDAYVGGKLGRSVSSQITYKGFAEALTLSNSEVVDVENVVIVNEILPV